MPRVTMARSSAARFSQRGAMRLEPVDWTLDLGAPPMGGVVEVGLARLVLAGRDHRLDPPRPEPAAGGLE